MKWIMVANSNNCRIYEYYKNVKKIKCIDTITHPENKLKVHDLVSDQPGHYRSRGTVRGSYAPSSNPLEVAIDCFAREIAKKLDLAKQKHKYDEVTLLLPSEMEGVLYKHLSKQVMQSIRKIIQKNLMKFSDHELKQYLAKAA